MARKPPDIKSIPDVEFQPKNDVIYQGRRYQLITPLFGGGVDPKNDDEKFKADLISIVRGSEVRGHLRFWWRATQLGRFSSLKELRNAENILWGSSKTPSNVNILVYDYSYKQEEYVYEVKSIKNNPPKPFLSNNVAAYAAFPLQPDKDHSSDINWKSAKVLLDVKFSLELQFPKINEKEIMDSLWAWETFGGIGARTRRGFGALSCDEKEEISKKPFRNWLESCLQSHTYEVKDPIVGIPYLSRELGKYAFVSTNKQPIPCWKDMIDLLQKFRQEKARFKDKFGLSQWPESNAIRYIFEHELKFPDDGKSHNLINKFPRAKFGLPINFHLPHDKYIPDDIVLHGKQIDEDKWIDRMASPLILRPVKWIGGSVGLAAVLQWHHNETDESYTPPGGLRLKGAPGNPEVKSDLESEELSELPMLNQTDILIEFLDFIKSNGGTKK